MRIPVVINECIVYLLVIVVVDFIFLVINFFLRIPGYIGIVVSLLCLLCFIALLYFFRDPERNVVADEKSVLSPADGTVLSVVNENESEYINSKVNKISIFLSVFNVHIQRAPVSGKIEIIKHISGKFLAAWKDEASTKNEQNYICVSVGNGKKILVKQIAGVIARRTVCWVKEKDSVKVGQRIGMIKFGSRVEILLPENIEIRVKKGDKVIAGETVIGVIN